MLGNVWEWVDDWYDENYYKNSPSQDPQGPPSGEDLVVGGHNFGPGRVLRGWFWLVNHWDVRVSGRYWDGPARRREINGFRCAGEVVIP